MRPYVIHKLFKKKGIRFLDRRLCLYTGIETFVIVLGQCTSDTEDVFISFMTYRS